MKGKILIIAVLISALIYTGTGCGLTGRNEAVDMMKKVPQDSDSFMFVDIDAFRTDSTLEQAYADLEGSIEEMTEFFGITCGEVDRITTTGGTYCILLEGDFNLGELRGNLEELGYDNDEYNSTEVWGQEEAGILIAVISNKLIIIGTEADTTACIEIIRGGEASLCDNEDARDVTERLPNRIIFICTEGVTPISYNFHDGLKFAGVSATKKDANSLAFTMALKFEDGNSASAAMDEIEYDLENDVVDDWKTIDVTRDAEFIEVTMELDIDDLFN
jgi:hypothetical protein